MIRSLAIVAALVAAIPAQLTFQAQTRTDYGALASTSTASDFESVAAQTAIGSAGLVVAATLGSTRESAFSATTRVTVGSRNPDIASVEIAEVGVARTQDVAGGSAGTSPSQPSSTSPVYGAHALSLHVDARQGVRCRVSIAWSGAATAAASVRTAIDVDGDQVPDFTASAGGRITQDLFVVAGGTGVTIDIATEGRATLGGAGSENYSAALGVTVALDGGGGGNCTITPFGAECGGRLTGTATSGTRDLSIVLNVTGAAANAIGILVVGDRLLPPIPLPGSAARCELFVLPRLSAAVAIDGSGAGRASVRVPGGQPIDTNAQVVTLSVGTGIDLASTNGLNIVCR